jgi:hypothetical protein
MSFSDRAQKSTCLWLTSRLAASSYVLLIKSSVTVKFEKTYLLINILVTENIYTIKIE